MFVTFFRSAESSGDEAFLSLLLGVWLMLETLSLLRFVVTNKFGVAGRRVCFSRALSENQT